MEADQPDADQRSLGSSVWVPPLGYVPLRPDTGRASRVLADYSTHRLERVWVI